MGMYLRAKPISESWERIEQSDAPERLNVLTVIREVVEDVVVGDLEERARDQGDLREDVTSRSSVLASLQTSERVSSEITASKDARRTWRRVPNCPLGSRT